MTRWLAMPRLLLACALGLGMIFATASQARVESQMIFHSLSLKDGLSQSTVNDVLQDSRGFLWFATENGLNRYDGRSIRRFMRDQSNPHALPSDFIWSIAEDAAGDLWLATEGAGLVRWRRDTGHFSRVPVARDSGDAEIRLARTVLIDGAGDIWIGTRGGGLFRFDSEGNLSEHYWPGGQQRDTVSSLAAMAPGLLLVGTDAGLFELHTASGNTRRVPAVNSAVSSLLRDDRGRLWVGTYDSGLLRIDASGSTVGAYRHDPVRASSLSGNQVRDMLQDRDGRIWVATQQGLNLYLGEEQGFLSYRHKDNDHYSLADDRLMSLHQSRDGVLWIGTRLGGVSRWSPRSWDLGAKGPPELASAAVLAFADAGDGDTWVGGVGTPLLRLDPAGRTQAVFAPGHGFPDRGEAHVTALLRDREARLWIGTMSDGLQVYTPHDGRLRQLVHDPGDPDSLGANGIMSLYQDSEGTIWAGSFGGGLARVDARTLAVKRYADGLRVTVIREDAAGQLWLGTDGNGLVRVDPRTGELHFFGPRPETSDNLGADTVYALHISDNGTVWVGTAGVGLAMLTGPEAAGDTPVFKHLTTADGLSNNVINGILEDASGDLWLSSNAGLMRLDPASSEVRYFHRAQGLQSEEFNYGASYRSADGRLFFGGSGGYNAFDPAEFSRRGEAPRLALTGIEVLNKRLEAARPLSDLDSLVLRHNDDVVTLEYVALDFTAPERNRYSVRLKGFDREWTPASTRHRSTYTNLDAGDYVFQVRAASSEGVWSEEPLELAVRVKAAPWATPQAYAVYIVLVAALVYGFFRWRLRVLEREARIRQLAYYDRSTGLPNLDLFTQRATAALEQARNEGRALVVISLRLTTLRRLRSSFGQQSIDEILRTLGPRLTQQLFGSGRTSATRDLARISETEIAAFLVVDDPMVETAVWVRRLSDSASAPIDLAGHQLHIPVHVGIAGFPRDGDSAATVIKCASIATHDRGTGDTPHFAYYDSEMADRTLDRIGLESQLRQAIREGSLDLFLQGKFDADGRLVGAEALVRWFHPQRGAVSPGVFVPLAEESDLILELDEWVLDQACRTLQRWQRQGVDKLNIAVNVSAETFVSGHLVETLAALQVRYQLDPTCLEIEITETALASDLDKVSDALQRVKSLGHPLALDDFGTGYSSLTYLQRFPIDNLKIDQAFVREIEHRSDQQALCRAIIALAKSLNLRTTAEGVENQEQRDLVVAMACDLLQGYHLHRPQPLAAFESEFVLLAAERI